jgi:two-component system CheB/CheR fusion protein
MKKAQELMKEANAQARLAAVVRDSYDAILLMGLDGRIMGWNPAAQRIFGWSEAEALAMNIRDMVPEELREEELDRIQQIIKGETQEAYETQRIVKDGRIVRVWLTATALVDKASRTYAIATTERVPKSEE